VQFRSKGVTLFVDGRETRYEIGRPFSLPTGAHQFRLVPNDSSCHEQAWSAVVESGTDVQEIRPPRQTLDCEPTT
jgi:hypothetical protein